MPLATKIYMDMPTAKIGMTTMANIKKSKISLISDPLKYVHSIELP